MDASMLRRFWCLIVNSALSFTAFYLSCRTGYGFLPPSHSDGYDRQAAKPPRSRQSGAEYPQSHKNAG